MKRSGLCIAALVALALTAGAASAQSTAGLDKLYILNCGEGVAGDISRWSPGVNVGQPMPFVDNCYLMQHAQGWLLWDTGVADAIAAMPEGQAPQDPRMTHWRRPKTLAGELEAIGVKPSDIKYVVVSHTHPDHIGNVALFPQAMLLVQKAEYEWPTPFGTGRFKPEHPVTKLEATTTSSATTASRSSRRPGTPPATSRCWCGCRRPARSCSPATPSTSRATGTIAACPRTTPTRTRRSPRCSASPTCWRRRRRSSGSITTRPSATASPWRRASTSEGNELCNSSTRTLPGPLTRAR